MSARRRLRNYSKGVGNVQDVPLIDLTVPLFTLFFGRSTDVTPNEATVLGLGTIVTNDVAQELNFGDANDEYLYFAIPKSVQTNTLIDINGFPVSFVKTDVSVTVDGSPVLYEVNRSEFKQNGTVVGTIIEQ